MTVLLGMHGLSQYRESNESVALSPNIYSCPSGTFNSILLCITLSPPTAATRFTSSLPSRRNTTMSPTSSSIQILLPTIRLSLCKVGSMDAVGTYPINSTNRNSRSGTANARAGMTNHLLNFSINFLQYKKRGTKHTLGTPHYFYAA